MADIREYKCPACGGAMEFDSKTQKMKCPYCDTVADLSDFEETQSEKTASKEGAEQGETQEAAEEGAMMLYVCESCGGEILADKTTGATSCPYCGNKVVMKGQFDGALRPDYIIPFKKDKKQAKEAYRKHLEGKKFLPGVFKQQNHIDEIKGVYVPFWIFDLKAKADFSYHAEKTRIMPSTSPKLSAFALYSASVITSVTNPNSPSTSATTTGCTFPNTSCTFASSVSGVPLTRTKNLRLELLMSVSSSFLLLQNAMMLRFRCLASSTTSATTALAVGSLPAPLP